MRCAELRLLTLTSLLSCALACRPAPVSEHRPWTALELARVGPPPQHRSESQARITTPAAEPVPWTIQRGGAGRIVELRRASGEVVHGLDVRAEGPRVLGAALAVAAQDIDFAELELWVAPGEEEFVRLSFYNGKRDRAWSALEVVDGATAAQVVRFDLRAMRDLEGPLDRVLVHFAGRARESALCGLHLGRRSATELLPDAAVGAGLVTLGHDGRRGLGLHATETLVARFTPSPGAELRFSYRTGRSAEVGAAELVVRAGSATRRVPLAGGDTAAWADVAVAVDAAGSGEASFTLEAGAGAPGFDPHTVIADVGVYAPGAATGGSANAQTVVLITSDTHRGDMLGALGGTRPNAEYAGALQGVSTPNLDALAARGVLFIDAVAPSNATNPSHASLLTGLHVRDTRIVTNSSPLGERAMTLAEHFRAAGYRTAAAVSVVHLGHAMSGFGQGFDRFDSPPFPTGAEVEAHRGSEDSVRLGELTVAAALAHTAAAEGMPLFLWVHVYDAHVPYLPEPGFDRRYYPEGLDPRSGPGLPVEEQKLHGSFAGIRDPIFPWHQYRALVDYVDHALAPVLDLPRARQGIIAFTADHGESFGNHGMWYDHRGIFRDNTHIPLILAWPGAPSQMVGARVTAPVGLMDVGRTLLDLAGLGATEFDGRDLRRAAEGDWPAEPRYSIAGGGKSISLDDGRWVLVLHMEDDTSDDTQRAWRRGQVELFDRASDPECTEDVVAANVERARTMRRAVLRWLDGAAEEGLSAEFFVTPRAAAELAKLGYAAGTSPTGAWYVPGDDDWELKYERR